MQFVYIFSLMFLSIFGLAVLIKLVAWTLLTRGVCRHDVYVRCGEDISGFVESVRKDPHVSRVVILSAGNEWDKDAEQLAARYGNVHFIKK